MNMLTKISMLLLIAGSFISADLAAMKRGKKSKASSSTTSSASKPSTFIVNAQSFLNDIGTQSFDGSIAVMSRDSLFRLAQENQETLLTGGTPKETPSIVIQETPTENTSSSKSKSRCSLCSVLKLPLLPLKMVWWHAKAAWNNKWLILLDTVIVTAIGFVISHYYNNITPCQYQCFFKQVYNLVSYTLQNLHIPTSVDMGKIYDCCYSTCCKLRGESFCGTTCQQ